MASGKWREVGPIEMNTIHGVYFRTFETLKTLWLKFELYGLSRPKGKWRKSGDLSYWRLKSLSFSYASVPTKTKLTIVCQLESREYLPDLTCEVEVDLTLYEFYQYLCEVHLGFEEKHNCKWLFCGKDVNLELPLDKTPRKVYNKNYFQIHDRNRFLIIETAQARLDAGFFPFSQEN